MEAVTNAAAGINTPDTEAQRLAEILPFERLGQSFRDVRNLDEFLVSLQDGGTDVKVYRSTISIMRRATSRLNAFVTATGSLRYRAIDNAYAADRLIDDANDRTARLEDLNATLTNRVNNQYETIASMERTTASDLEVMKAFQSLAQERQDEVEMLQDTLDDQADTIDRLQAELGMAVNSLQNLHFLVASIRGAANELEAVGV